jgi:phospholipid-binding lipoprotein MlaA
MEPEMATRLSITACFGVALALTTVLPAFAWAADDVWDPLESLNRASFDLNAALSKVIAEPVASAYHSAVPTTIQTGVDDFFTNLREPVTAVSSGIEGDFQNAGVSVGRFAINSTVGIAGLFDVATEMGWVSRPEDIGAALCSYGVHPGPYIVVPVLGPTTAREAVASLSTFIVLGNAVTGDATVNYLVTDRVAARISEGRAGAPATGAAPAAGDAYVAQRDAYLAFREQVCKNGIPADQLKASPFGSVAPKG